MLPLCKVVDLLLGQILRGVQMAKRSSCLHHVGRQVPVFLCMGQGWGIILGMEGRRGTYKEIRKGRLWSQLEERLPEAHLVLAVSITLDHVTCWLMYSLICISQSV